MGTFSDGLTATSLRLLTAYGQSISVARTVTGAYAVSTGTVATTSTTTYTGYGLPTNYAAQQIDGTLIRQDGTLLIFSSTTVPEVDDVFTVGTKALTALNVQQINAQGANIVYRIQCRQ